MKPAQQPYLAEALDRLWAQFLPQMEERVATLEMAAQSFGEDRLSEKQHAAANTAAHKLAGVLGSFGLTRGTVLARELEIMYSRENGRTQRWRHGCERLPPSCAPLWRRASKPTVRLKINGSARSICVPAWREPSVGFEVRRVAPGAQDLAGARAGRPGARTGGARVRRRLGWKERFRIIARRPRGTFTSR